MEDGSVVEVRGPVDKTFESQVLSQASQSRSSERA